MVDIEWIFSPKGELGAVWLDWYGHVDSMFYFSLIAQNLTGTIVLEYHPCEHIALFIRAFAKI